MQEIQELPDNSITSASGVMPQGPKAASHWPGNYVRELHVELELLCTQLQVEATLSIPTMTMSHVRPYELRAKYTRFRILVIGRANAGKTTLLQRVCNTTDDPCIYDNDKNLVSCS